MKIKNKVFAYITHGNRLLIFRHVDFPEAGLQVPAGTKEELESSELAVLREAKEETGLNSLYVDTFLGECDYLAVEKQEMHRRRYYHLVCDELPKEIWTHSEKDPSCGGKPILFELYWISLDDGMPKLIAEHDRFIPELQAHLNQKAQQIGGYNSE